MKAPQKKLPQKQDRISIPPIIWQGALGFIIILFGFAAFKMINDEVKDYTKATDSQLKALFFCDRPQVIYCHRGNKDETIPSVIANYKSLVKNKVGVAMVNCSHVLPSGKNVWDRFKIKKDWKPAVFALAPWTKPKQLTPTNMKDVTTLKKVLDATLQPKGTDCTTEKELAKFCNFYAAKSSMDTCMVLFKGARYTKAHGDLEEKYVKKFPQVKIASIDATKMRFSFEDTKEDPADSYALKLFALRNGTYYQSMMFPATLDYMSSFTTDAIGSPLESYTPTAIKFVKVSTSSFKDRTVPRVPPSNSNTVNSDGSTGTDNDARSARKNTNRAKTSPPSSGTKTKKTNDQSSSSSSAEESTPANEEVSDNSHHASSIPVDEDAEVIEL